MAAAWVLVSHFHVTMGDLLPFSRQVAPLAGGGYLGVEVFFVLSGFIISYQYADRLRSPSAAGYRRFLELRLARIYPVHLLTLATMGLLALAAAATGARLNSETVYTPLSLAMNLLLLQAVPPALAWNLPAWSVGAEAGAYAAFPLVAVVLGRVTSRLATFGGVAVALGCTVAGVSLAALAGPPGGWSPISHTVIWVRIAGEFTAGCLLWAYWRRFGGAGRSWDAVAVWCVAATAAVLYWTVPKGPDDFVVLPLIALFVYACASATGPVRRFLGSRLLVYGGRISYSLYMTHFIVILVGERLVPWERFAGAGLAARLGVVSGYLCAVIAVAVATYHLVEEPGRKFLRHLAGVRQAPAEAGGGGARVS